MALTKGHIANVKVIVVYIFSQVTWIWLMLHMIVVHDQKVHQGFHFKSPMSRSKFTHSLKRFPGHYFLPVVNLHKLLLCCLQSIAAQREHFVHLSICLSGSHTFLVVTYSYISQASRAFPGMLPLFCVLGQNVLSWPWPMCRIPKSRSLDLHGCFYSLGPSICACVHYTF